MTSDAQGLHLFGVTLIGATPQNLHKLVLTIVFIVVAWALTKLFRAALHLLVGSRTGTRVQFWAKQGVSLVIAAIV